MRAIAVALLLLSGQAFAYELIAYGKNTWMIMTKSVSPSKARIVAVKEATAYCQKLGKVMQPKSESGDQGGPPLRSKDFSLIFSCYAQDDPRLHEPNMRKEPDVVIETR
jgi:hypothetical protein